MTEISVQGNLPEKNTDKRLRLHYLDGLRGIAALYVVFSHIWEMQGKNLPNFWLNISQVFQYGSFSVSVFIVLSGYCLMLPVSRSQSSYISGSLLNYFKRRARRILPPYYAALVLSIFVALIFTILLKLNAFPWDDKLLGHFSRKFVFSDVILHLLLIHNLAPGARSVQINGPMWSVATEWQIYFLFPLLLLPIWRRWGLFVVVSIAFLLGLTPHYLLDGMGDGAAPWYLGLFTLGMTATEIGFSEKQHLSKIKNLIPWGLLTIISAALAFLADWNKLGLDKWIGQSLAGLATACLLIYCTNNITESRKPSLVLQAFQSPLAIVLGTFSYSLYLLHVLVLTPLNQYLHTLHLNDATTTIILYLVTPPASLFLAYSFYLLFERPFMSNFLQKRKVKDTINTGRG